MQVIAIEVELTNRGLEAVNDVAAAVFSYLAMVRDEGIPSYIINEAETVSTSLGPSAKTPSRVTSPPFLLQTCRISRQTSISAGRSVSGGWMPRTLSTSFHNSPPTPSWSVPLPPPLVSHSLPLSLYRCDMLWLWSVPARTGGWEETLKHSLAPPLPFFSSGPHTCNIKRETWTYETHTCNIKRETWTRGTREDARDGRHL